MGSRRTTLIVEVMSNPPAPGKWDPWNMFDISPKERELVQKRQALLRANKEKFREMVNDPKIQGRGGWVLDPAVQRWYTARATRRNYFYPDGRSGLVFFSCVVFPIASLYYFGLKHKREREEEFRQGKVRILDRWTKFHY